MELPAFFTTTPSAKEPPHAKTIRYRIGCVGAVRLAAPIVSLAHVLALTSKACLPVPKLGDRSTAMRCCEGSNRHVRSRESQPRGLPVQHPRSASREYVSAQLEAVQSMEFAATLPAKGKLAAHNLVAVVSPASIASRNIALYDPTQS